MSNSDSPSAPSESLSCFELPRSVRRAVRSCASPGGQRPAGDVFYLWIQLGPHGESPALESSDWLNVVDEAASVGVNWLVVTLGISGELPHGLDAVCRWAQDTHSMTVCLHTGNDEPDPNLEALVASLETGHTYLLVEPEHMENFSRLGERGVHVGSANPVAHGEDSQCDFPYKMVFVNPAGNLYTCGLVAGETEFFLGSVFKGSMEQVVHNPKLPHSVDALEARPRNGCSGCPPLVAKYLCQES